MILRRGAHRYNSKLYPDSGLPGPNVIAFENALAFAAEFGQDADRSAGQTVRAPYDAVTRRER